jgi:cytosine/adenosine deaminase-related metal-dependent hydrolase
MPAESRDDDCAAGAVLTAHTAPVVLPMTGPPVRDGAVLVDGDRLAAVGRASEVVPDGVRVRSHRGVLMPGLVNAHAHLEYGPPFADLATSGLPFAAWIAELTARRRGMDDAAWLASARGSVHGLLRTGTTCVADLVTTGPGIRAAALAGLAGVSYVEAVGADDATWPAERARVEALLDSGGRLLGVSPHTLYTLGSRAFRDCAELARSRGLRLHPHLAETVEEAELVLSGTGTFADALRRVGLAHDLLGTGAGRTPAQQADALGGLGADVHVAHGVHLSAADRELLRARSTAVALCRRSNAVLQAGEPPVADLLAEGSPIALGTDSLASCPDLDLVAEARATRDLALRQGAPAEGLAERLLHAATVGGAAAMGLDGPGTLRPGGRADLAVFDVPEDGDPYDAVLDHGAGRCTATVLAGRLVHRR